MATDAPPVADPFQVKNADGDIIAGGLSKSDSEFHLHHQPEYQDGENQNGQEGENQNGQESNNILVSESDDDNVHEQLNKKFATVTLDSKSEEEK